MDSHLHGNDKMERLDSSFPTFPAFARTGMTTNYHSRKNEDENDKIESFSEISIQGLDKYIL